MKKLLAFVAYNVYANKYALHALVINNNAFCGEGSSTVTNFDCLSDILMLYIKTACSYLMVMGYTCWSYCN